MEEAAKASLKFGRFIAAIVLSTVLFLSYFVFGNPLIAEAATLYVSPSTGTYNVGATFSVSVYTSSNGTSINAVSGVLSFPPSVLEVTGLSKSGSVMSLWVQEPSYSNSTGTVSFEGVILNPGYEGSAGKILTVTFKAKSAGDAHVAFSSGSALANDGLGTNVLSSFGVGNYTIGGEKPVETPTPTPTPQPVTAPPAAPTVSSSTHPNSDAWYSSNDPAFSWSLPSSVTGVNVLANQTATTDPGTNSDGVISRYTYTDVDDGTWYFHVKLQNEKGWGGTTHFRFNIDTVPPEPFSVELVGNDPVVVSEPSIRFSTTDALSGIDHYVVRINELEVATVSVDDLGEDGIYTLPAQGSGEKKVTVEAFDKAGNSSSAETSFTVTLPEGEEPTPEAPGWFTRLGEIVQAAVAGAIMLLLLAALIFIIWFAVRHLSHDLIAFSKRHQGGELAVRRALMRTRRHLVRDREFLEHGRRAKRLSETSERIIRKVSKMLDDLEDDISKEIDKLS